MLVSQTLQLHTCLFCYILQQCTNCTSQATDAAQTRELLRKAEEEEARQAAEPLLTSSGRRSHDEPEQRWDCESVLSMRSNLDNHPGVISEQPTRRYRPVGGKIKLAAKTGHSNSVHCAQSSNSAPSALLQLSSLIFQQQRSIWMSNMSNANCISQKSSDGCCAEACLGECMMQA